MSYSEDKKLAKMAKDMIDLIFCVALQSTIEGLYSGAYGRIYKDAALNHADAGFNAMINLYFGGVHKINSRVNVTCLISEYIPSDFVYSLYEKTNEATPYEGFESIHLHSIDEAAFQNKLPEEKGSINRYTYKTKNYVLGAVNFQDKYENSEAKWYAHHQQHEWEVTLYGGTDIKIFTHHSGHFGVENHEHGYWTGDLGCCCGSFFAHKNIALAMYDIPIDKMEFIHAFLPAKYFNIETLGKSIFLEYKNIFISMIWSNDFEWTKEGENAGREVTSKGRKHAVALEVGDAFNSMEEFKKHIIGKKICFDKKHMTFQYGDLYMDKEVREISGERQKFPYPSIYSPFMKSDFDSEIVDILVDNKCINSLIF